MADPAVHPLPSFTGFDFPEQNWFKMPNNWTDLTSEMSSIAEMKIVEYILKHTWGYQEYGVKKAITTDEFRNGRKRKDGTRLDKGTCLSKQSVITGIKLAIKRGLLEEEVDDRDKARVKKYYFLRMKKGGEPQESGGGVKKLDSDVQSLDTGVQDLDSQGQTFGHRTEQEAIERNQQQEGKSYGKFDTTENNNRGIAAALVKRGVDNATAQRLANEHTRDCLLNNIQWFDHTLKTRPQKADKNPPGLLIRAITNDIAAEGHQQDFQTQQQKEMVRTKKKAALAVQQKLLETLKQQQVATLKQQELARAKQLEILRERHHTTAQDGKLWQKILDKLRAELSLLKFKTYLAHSELLSLKNDQAIICVPSHFIGTWVEKNLSTKLQQLLGEYSNEPNILIQCRTLDAPKIE